MSNLKTLANKYLFPAILILAGLFFLLRGFVQVGLGGTGLLPFVWGALAVILTGGLALLYSMGLIKKKLQRILTIVLVLACVLFAYFNYKSINDKIAYLDDRARFAEKVVQRMKDVRTAQEAFYDAKGTYSNNWDSLIYFVKNGQVPIYKSIGSIPDSVAEMGLQTAIEKGYIVSMPDGMSDEEAAESGLIIRDTLYVSVLEERFMTEEALSKRKFNFNIDSLRYSPYQGEFLLKTGDVELGGVKRPTVLCQESDPYPGADTLMMGSLSEAHLNGNWKE